MSHGLGKPRPNCSIYGSFQMMTVVALIRVTEKGLTGISGIIAVNTLTT